MAQHSGALRVLICEDEFLLANDMATELARRGVCVAGIVARVADARAALDREGFDANAAVLDIKLLDGEVFPVVPLMLARGMAVVFCTGYSAQDLPPEFAHLLTVGKPTDIEELLRAFTHVGEAEEGDVP